MTGTEQCRLPSKLLLVLPGHAPRLKLRLPCRVAIPARDLLPDMSDMGFADTLSAVLRRSLGPMAGPEAEGSHPFPGTAGGRMSVPSQGDSVPMRGQARAGVPFPSLHLAGGPPRGELLAHGLT